MNYIKIFREVYYHDAEAEVNQFLKEVAEKGHRVVKCQARMELNTISFVFSLDDYPQLKASRKHAQV